MQPYCESVQLTISQHLADSLFLCWTLILSFFSFSYSSSSSSFLLYALCVCVCEYCSIVVASKLELCSNPIRTHLRALVVANPSLTTVFTLLLVG